MSTIVSWAFSGCRRLLKSGMHCLTMPLRRSNFISKLSFSDHPSVFSTSVNLDYSGHYNKTSTDWLTRQLRTITKHTLTDAIWRQDVVDVLLGEQSHNVIIVSGWHFAVGHQRISIRRSDASATRTEVRQQFGRIAESVSTEQLKPQP